MLVEGAVKGEDLLPEVQLPEVVYLEFSRIEVVRRRSKAESSTTRIFAMSFTNHTGTRNDKISNRTVIPRDGIAPIFQASVKTLNSIKLSYTLVRPSGPGFD